MKRRIAAEHRNQKIGNLYTSLDIDLTYEILKIKGIPEHQRAEEILKIIRARRQARKKLRILIPNISLPEYHLDTAKVAKLLPEPLRSEKLTEIIMEQIRDGDHYSNIVKTASFLGRKLSVDDIFFVIKAQIKNNHKDYAKITAYHLYEGL